MHPTQSHQFFSVKLYWLVIPTFILLVFACCFPGYLLAQKVPGDKKSTKAETDSANISGRIEFPQDDPVETKRTILIRGLIKIVQDDKIINTDRLRIHKAMLRLGRMKALEAIPAIAERLDVHVSKYGTVINQEPTPQHVHYPAIKALGLIGEGAMPYIVDSLVIKKRSKLFQENALRALTEITGHRDKAEQYLRNRIAFYRKGSRLTLPLYKE